MVWTPLAAALAEAVEGPPDDDDYPDDYSASCAAEDASIEARDETQDPASDISAAETFYRSTWREKHLSRAGPI